MQVEVGYCDNPDSVTAGLTAVKMALEKSKRTNPCDMVLLFCTARHEQQLLRNAVASVAGTSVPVYGGGAAGIITNEYYGYAGDQVGVACIWLDDSRCTVLAEGDLEKSEIETGKRLGRQLLEAGVTSDSSVLLFYDAIDRTNGNVRLLVATWLLKGLETGLGFLPEIMGAGLQGDHSSSVTRQYIGEQLGEHYALSFAFSDDICVDNIIMHGCRPATPYYTVTKADGPVILEINGKPALTFVDELLESAISPENYPFFLLFGLNHGNQWDEYDEENYASRLCLDIDRERDGIVMFEPDMTEGVQFQIMFRSLDLDYMKPKIEQIFANLNGREPLFALYIDCAGRCAGYGGVDMEDAIVIQRAVGTRVPLLGIYTGAEIAPMGGHSRGLDLTGVFCLFSKKRQGECNNKERSSQSVWNHLPVHKKEDISLSAALRLCERNAAKVLAIDNQTISIRHELEQKRRGFSLLAELAVSLREGGTDKNIFALVTQRINAALNMQKTVVLSPDADGQFIPSVMQGYSEKEKEILLAHPVKVDAALLDPKTPVLVTAAEDARYLAQMRKILGLPYFVSAPVVIKDEVVAVLITGRMVEASPFLSRLGRSDVETVQAVSALLSSVLVYHKLEVANRQAQSDDLTGLLNRSALETQVTQCLQEENRRNKNYAFIIIDCDCFKDINDKYGHMEGDMVLNTLAQFLSKNFRANDNIARIGGDEFAVFCLLEKESINENVRRRMEDVVRSWNELILTTKSDISFASTISVGISLAPQDGTNFVELFRKADAALYKSKEEGRNRYTIYDAHSMNEMH